MALKMVLWLLAAAVALLIGAYLYLQEYDSLAAVVERSYVELSAWPKCKAWSHDAPMATKGLTFFSQQVQDWAVFMVAVVDADHPGTYIDLASNHYSFDSNTFFFDRCLRWRGVCVEPNPRYHSGLRQGRSCDLVPTCIASEDGTHANFEGSDQSAHATPANTTSGNVWPHLRCTSLATILRARNISHVNYLSLDVEGYELNALHGIDWEAVRFDIMTVERAEGPVRNFLASKGYEAAFCASLDTVFIRSGDAALKGRARKFLDLSSGNGAARECIQPAGTTCQKVWEAFLDWRRRGRPMD